MTPARLLEAYLEHAHQEPVTALDLVARPEPSLAARVERARLEDQQRFNRAGLPRRAA